MNSRSMLLARQRSVSDLLASVPAWLAIACYVLLVRIPSFPPSVIDPDESLFILMGRELLHGNLPYVGIVDNKPFGVPAAFALGLTVFGQSVFAARLLGTVCTAASAILLRRIALAAGLERGPAFAVALLFASFGTQLDGLPTMTEVLLMPFSSAAMLIAFRNRDCAGLRRQGLATFAMALLFGLAIWIKYIPAVLASLTFAALMLFWWLNRRVRLVHIAGLAALFGLGCALPTLLTGLFYWAAGHWNDFWWANFGYMSGYMSQPLQLYRLELVAERNWMELWPLLGLAAVGAIVGLRRDGDSRSYLTSTACLLWLAAEFAAATVQIHFFAHYFLLSLPPLALLAGFSLQYVATEWAQPPKRQLVAIVAALCIGLFPLNQVAHAMTRDWLNLGQPDASRRIAALIRQDQEPHPSLWVANTDAIIIYFETGAALPTRYPFASPLIGSEPLNWITGKDPIAELQHILEQRPTFIVTNKRGWDELRPEVQQATDAALARDYHPIGAAAGGHLDLTLYRRNPS